MKEDLVVPLWSDGAPGALGKEPKDAPTITVRLPKSETPTGALVICPGGGYGGLAMDHEGHQIVEWANAMGLAAVLCDYRHRGKGYGHPAPLQDAQRAIRLTRFHAAEWNIDPNKIGIIGFSAGGHLVSTVITQFEATNESTNTPSANTPSATDRSTNDSIEARSSRPDFAILCYPVISMGSAFTHRGSEVNLLGKDAPPETLQRFASERNVRSDTPPTFLLHTLEDKAVPPGNSLVFYQAMVAMQVPGELHIYQKGQHGIGLAKSIPGASDWPLACQRWLHQLGMVSSAQPTP
jgi:acetyl esterase/lipase